MKAAGSVLTSTLYDNNIHYVADCFSITLPDGVVRLTSADVDVVSASLTWSAGGEAISRGAAKTAVGMEIATIDLTLAQGSGTYFGYPLQALALRGDFDGARLQFFRAYSTSSVGDTTAGFVTVFDGNIYNVEPGSTEVVLSAKSLVTKMERSFPPRMIQPQCPYQFGDSQCGVTLASYTAYRNSAAGSTRSTINFDSTALTTNLYALGKVVIESGPMADTERTITANAGNTLSVVPPLPQDLSAGEQLSIIQGCDKRRVTCSGTFSNIARFGGFPDAPRSS